MADERDPSKQDKNAPTVRDLKGPGGGDTIPDVVGLYVPPRPLPEASQHRTIDIRPVRLSAQADPRRALTERRLVSPTQPERRRTAWWMIGGLAALLGGAAWAILSQPSAPNTPAAASDPPAAVPEPPAEPIAAPPPSPAPPASVAVEPAPSAAAPVRPAPPVRPEAPSTAPAAKKTEPAPEAPKKRRDPWLE